MRDCCGGCKKEECVKKVPIFSILSPAEFEDVAMRIAHERFEKNDLIFAEGDRAKTMYFVNVGKIKLYKYTKDGKEQILNILSDGDFFGELNLLKESKYTFNAMAMGDCKVCKLTKDDLRNLMLEKPEISIKVLELMGDRLAKMESLAQNLATNDVDSRLAYLLTNLSKEYGIKGDTTIEINLPMNREAMASFIGVARETISRKLKKFQEEGLIKVVGAKQIIILDKVGLDDYI